LQKTYDKYEKDLCASYGLMVSLKAFSLLLESGGVLDRPLGKGERGATQHLLHRG
jgi:hypothetical protein